MAFIKITALAALYAAGEEDLHLLQTAVQHQRSDLERATEVLDHSAHTHRKMKMESGPRGKHPITRPTTMWTKWEKSVGISCPAMGVLKYDPDFISSPGMGKSQVDEGVMINRMILTANPPKDTDRVPTRSRYALALKKLDIKAVEKDLTDLMSANYQYWPNDADFNHYGPFFIRLAWHCSGSFRATDGRGGCAGGRLRFEPERSWPDNTNLDKARSLLFSIKRKYGDGLSWGDLYTAAGTIAIQSMGGPTKPFCFGRPDDKNGKKSKILNRPCKDPNGRKLKNGKCVGPWGPTTVGLIYVNPEGPIGADGHPQVDPRLSAIDIQDSFGRMGFNAMEIVALIGGGHAFGKCHGACADKGPGKNPAAAFGAKSCGIWNGTCGGDGKGANTVTSGFEGPWTTTPTKWSNEFFKGLLEEKWEKHKGPGGLYQWRTANRTSKRKDTMRLTSDLALLEDPVYRAMVELFAKDQNALDNAFAHAWTQLIEAGTTWSTARKCQEIPISGFCSPNHWRPGCHRPIGWAAWMPEPAWSLYSLYPPREPSPSHPSVYPAKPA